MAAETNTPFNEHVCVKTVEMHTAGEPLRIIVSGFPKIEGRTILDRRRYVKEHLDHYRKLTVNEPRGHFDMYCALLVEPSVPEADIAVLFMHNEGYSTMCGHAVISLGRYAVDACLIKKPTIPETKVNIQCPCGLVTAFVQYDGKKTGSVRFLSVPAFVYKTDVEVTVERFGKINVDISYGGAFYAFIAAHKIGLNLDTSKVADLNKAADDISAAVKREIKIESPENADLGFLYGTIITDDNDSYSCIPTSNICVFADRQVDRSPCGSGVTARIALQYHKGLIGLNQTRQFQSSATKAIFTGKAVREVGVGQYKGVEVEVSGKGFYTGKSEFTLEEDDFIGRGFII
ncbi:hypothetical protein SNE40_009330 [Patella caerulea]|uniref:trans-L-3-hydroxyproline dehydratase n=2 Tax=Patella caerulea TaxID=87958 RepID=A0AAN8JXE2_PATCE